MGYLGFGLQKWIFTQRPRKPFSKETKSSCNTISQPELKGFNNLMSDSSNAETLDKKIQERSKRMDERRIVSALVGLLFLAILVFLLYISFSGFSNAIKRSPESVKLAKEQVKKDNELAFDLAVKSGTNRLANGEYDLAIKELERALRLKPSDVDAERALAEAYNMTCLKSNKNCDKAIKMLTKLIALDSTTTLISKRYQIYLRTNNYDAADRDFELMERINTKTAK